MELLFLSIKNTGTFSVQLIIADPIPEATSDWQYMLNVSNANVAGKYPVTGGLNGRILARFLGDCPGLTDDTGGYT